MNSSAATRASNASSSFGSSRFLILAVFCNSVVYMACDVALALLRFKSHPRSVAAFMKFDRRTFLATSSAAATISSRLPAAAPALLTPEDFGALGDGKTNDTRAFARLSDEVNRRGGGTTISLRAGRTYI